MEDSDTSVTAKLLRTMDNSPGFAGLGSSIETISRLGDDVDAGPREITATILRDAALTAKLLRIANSSRNARGGRNISTIDQALVILGLNTVKSVALSLALLGSLSRKPQSNLLHAEIVAAYFCGALAAEITRCNGARYSAQEAQVCGLLQNLGRMMATYYLYDGIERGRAIQAERNVAENDAVMLALGTSFEAIGAAIAAHWCLPDVIQNSLAPDIGQAPPRTAANAAAWHQFCSTFCRRVTDALFRLPENRERIEVNNHIEFFRGALRLKDGEVWEWVDKCLADTDALLGEMSFPCNVAQARNLLRKGSERVLDVLSSDDSLTKDKNRIDGRTPVEIIQNVLHLIHDNYGFDRTLLCLPDSSSGLIAIAGVGKNASQVTAKFRCGGPKPDLFRVIMARKQDIFIADTTAPAYAKLLPPWYVDLVGARSFVILPLLSGEKLLGLIYGDYEATQSASPTELAEGRMRDWREQLIQALRMGA